MIPERVQNRSARSQRRITFQLIERFAEHRFHFVQILFRRRFLIRRSPFNCETKPAKLHGTVANNTSLFNFQNGRINNCTNFLDFFFDNGVLVINVYQVAVRQILHNLHRREQDKAQNSANTYNDINNSFPHRERDITPSGILIRINVNLKFFH